MTRSHEPRPHDWPQYDPEMMREHGGRWVAVIPLSRTYLESGETPDQAMAAGRKTADRRGLNPNEVAVFAVCKPEDAWF
jgi:hypothetical protein